MNKVENTMISIIGLGYVGLPLAVAFGKKIKTIGFDINAKRIEQLKLGKDVSNEISKKEITEAKKLFFTNNLEEVKKCNFHIIAVPTPVDEFKSPDLTPLVGASNLVAKILKKEDVVVYESTVYPGATEEVCVPILEKKSGLKFNKDFYVGYSPERISPADNSNVCDIVKVTSGSTREAGKYVDDIYKQIITAGTFLVKNLKIAEACKVIENTQRDVNIAFMNEISMLLNKMGLDSQEVISAMKTKWNALSFVPGLVGGHCIGVDPYYLIYKSQQLGVDTEMMINARLVNDSIPFHIANEMIKSMCEKNINPNKSKILIMGASFKENCCDIRNSRTFDIANEILKYNAQVHIYDPIVNEKEVMSEYKIKLLSDPKNGEYDGIILAVPHKQFKEMGAEGIKKFGKKNKAIFFDIKAVFDGKSSDWRL